MAKNKEAYYVAKTDINSGHELYYGIKADIPDTAPFYTTNFQAATGFKSLKAARDIKSEMNKVIGGKKHTVVKITTKHLN